MFSVFSFFFIQSKYSVLQNEKRQLASKETALCNEFSNISLGIIKSLIILISCARLHHLYIFISTSSFCERSGGR